MRTKPRTPGRVNTTRPQLRSVAGRKPHVGVNRAYGKGRRYYSPTLARWLSRDPAEEEEGLALYGFVGANPVSALDFLGLDRILFWDAPGEFLATKLKRTTFAFDTKLVCWTEGNDYKVVDKIHWSFMVNAGIPKFRSQWIIKPASTKHIRVNRAERISFDPNPLKKIIAGAPFSFWFSAVFVDFEGDYDACCCGILRWVQQVSVSGKAPILDHHPGKPATDKTDFVYADDSTERNSWWQVGFWNYSGEDMDTQALFHASGAGKEAFAAQFFRKGAKMLRPNYFPEISDCNLSLFE